MVHNGMDAALNLGTSNGSNSIQFLTAVDCPRADVLRRTNWDEKLGVTVERREKKPIRIEKAGINHLREIVAVINAGATRVRKDKEFDNWQDYSAAFEALVQAPEADIYVALDEAGDVVGTYQIHFLKGLAFMGRPRAEIESVHVRSDQRGTGVGRIMMDHAEDLARKANACMVQLTSNRERDGSHHFYRKLGYDQSHLGYKKMLM